MLRDGTGYLETVVEINAVGEDVFEVLKACGIESAVELTGKIVAHFKKP